MARLSPVPLRDRCRGLSVGLYAAPLGALGTAAAAVSFWGGGILHFDVMDGVFVPQFTAGPGFVAALGGDLVRDVHLMVADPAALVDGFAEAGADILTIHAEAPTAAAALGAVRAAAARLDRPILAGLAVMPSTPIDSLEQLLALQPDLVLVLALDPRTGAAPDVAAAAVRLARIAHLTAAFRPLLAFDGGVTEATIGLAAAPAPGVVADIVVAGSAIYRAADPEAAFQRLQAAWMAAGDQARGAQHG